MKINGMNKWYEEKEKKDAHKVKKEQLYIFFFVEKRFGASVYLYLESFWMLAFDTKDILLK